MARRGLLAEMQRQARIAAREYEKAQREAERNRQAAIKEAERTRKAQERAAAQMARADAAEKKRLEKEYKEAHISAMQAEVEKRNLELGQKYEEIDSLLAATLDVDDFVDLDSLRTVAKHPKFDREDLKVPVSPPPPILGPPEPQYVPPPTPKGVGALLGKKKHEKAVQEASAIYQREMAKWKEALVVAEAARQEADKKRAEQEATRLTHLRAEESRYEAECSAREAMAEEQNKAVDALVANLAYGDVAAVQEYVTIVLSNSVYPSHFPVGYEFKFEPSTAELRLRVLIHGPDKIPSIKAYKYTKSTDEITETPLSQKACKDRYCGAVHQIALRSIHEVFEADRRGIIKTISLELGAETVNPATGLNEFILFVAVGAERNSFLELNLSNVLPSATLAHLGASLSKNPFGLVAADASGIRKS